MLFRSYPGHECKSDYTLEVSPNLRSNLGMRRVRHSIVLSLWPNCLRALLCCSACTRLRLRWIIYPVTLRSFIRKDSLFSLFVFCRAHCIRSEWIRIMGNCPGVLTHAMLEVRPVDHSVFRRSPLTRRCTLSSALAPQNLSSGALTSCSIIQR